MSTTDKNRIPQIIEDHISTVVNRNIPRFQRDLAAQTLERVIAEAKRALGTYYHDTNTRRN